MFAATFSLYYKYICEGGEGVKNDEPRSAECDVKSEKCQNTNECGRMVQDKSLQLINSNK